MIALDIIEDFLKTEGYKFLRLVSIIFLKSINIYILNYSRGWEYEATATSEGHGCLQ